ncbi:MAG: sensor domain-containing diguanylate cyclase [Chloroflexota bacterium]
MIRKESANFYQNEEDRRTARIISTLIFCAWATYLIVLVQGYFASDKELMTVTIIGSLLQLVPFYLLRRGNLSISSFIVVLSSIITIIFMATVGQGIKDLGVIAFPIIFIFAGLTLKKVYFYISVAITLLGLCWLTFGENLGYFASRPFDGDPLNLIYLLLVTVLMLVAAIAVDLLASNMRRTLQIANQEIDSRKRVEEALKESDERFNLVVDATRDGLWDWRISNDSCYFSPGYYHMLGYEVGDFPMTGQSWTELIHPDDRENAMYVNNECIKGTFDQMEIEYRMLSKTGEWHWIFSRGKCVSRDANGIALRLVGTHMDLTLRKQNEQQLRYQGTHDALTGIYNRLFFEEELERLERSREYPISILVADIDGLKTVNDTYGHFAGDELIQKATGLLSSVFRSEDVLARIGGDEFSALLPRTDSQAAEKIASRIREELKKNNQLFPGTSINISLGLATAEHDSLAKTFTLADQKMYQEKTEHKSGKL